MPIITTKYNGSLDSLYVSGPELLSFLNIIQTLWNGSDMTSNNEGHLKGIEAMHTIMKDHI